MSRKNGHIPYNIELEFGLEPEPGLGVSTDPNVSNPGSRRTSAISISGMMLRNRFPSLLLDGPASRSISGSRQPMFEPGNRSVEINPKSEVEWNVPLEGD